MFKVSLDGSNFPGAGSKSLLQILFSRRISFNVYQHKNVISKDIVKGGSPTKVVLMNDNTNNAEGNGNRLQGYTCLDTVTLNSKCRGCEEAHTV